MTLPVDSRYLPPGQMPTAIPAATVLQETICTGCSERGFNFYCRDCADVTCIDCHCWCFLDGRDPR